MVESFFITLDIAVCNWSHVSPEGPVLMNFPRPFHSLYELDQTNNLIKQRDLYCYETTSDYSEVLNPYKHVQQPASHKKLT